MDLIDLSDVRMVITPEDLQRVGQFRYGIYIEEQGKTARYADHQARTLIEPEDRDWNTRLFWVERAGGMLATIRVQRGPLPQDLAACMQLDTLPFGGQQNLLYFSRLMIVREARHSDVIGKIFVAGFSLAISNHLVAGVLTCAPALVQMFEMLGCTCYAKPFLHAEAGLQQPMAVLGEAEYLRKRGSTSLAKWLVAFKQDSPHTDDFLALTEMHRVKVGRGSPRTASRLAV